MSAAQPKSNSGAPSVSSPTTAHRIDGTAIAKAIREKINADIHHKQDSDSKYKPSLVIVQGKRFLQYPIIADASQSGVYQTQVSVLDFQF